MPAEVCSRAAWWRNRKEAYRVVGESGELAAEDHRTIASRGMRTGPPFRLSVIGSPWMRCSLKGRR